MIPTRAHNQPDKVQNPRTPPHPPIERNARSIPLRLPHQTRSGRRSWLLPAQARKKISPPASWPGPACSHLYLPCSVNNDSKSAVPTTSNFPDFFLPKISKRKVQCSAMIELFLEPAYSKQV